MAFYSSAECKDLFSLSLLCSFLGLPGNLDAHKKFGEFSDTVSSDSFLILTNPMIFVSQISEQNQTGPLLFFSTAKILKVTISQEDDGRRKPHWTLKQRSEKV